MINEKLAGEDQNIKLVSHGTLELKLMVTDRASIPASQSISVRKVHNIKAIRDACNEILAVTGE
jgi:hypothetical protein